MHAFDLPGDERIAPLRDELDEEDEEERGAGRGRRLLCRACRAPVTTLDARITVDGRHEHQGVNPGGYVHRFGCFSSAPGCASSGVPSKQWAWFPDHWWHAQVCRRCGAHLGWLFFRGDESFYGLVLAELVEEEPAPDA